MFKFLAVLFLFSGALAADVLHIKVKGMVCAFCTSGVRKKFDNHKEVSSVKVDMNEKLVTVKLKKNGRISDKEVKSLITSAGFSVDSIHRMSR